ncbi:hypothetical protein B0H17DRAFT_1130940 [Mycena rosella]|uniref:Uncharacterized protein n=1 Tax=Mycena rosella TaxID=1033263 RepID=A0AAD7DQ84_MYCRO|nr:hypothetical protein B0H17DRAFT_1130940 [Mycena rosella]
MGRALYSEKYGVNAIAVRVEPEPVQSPEPWRKWSLSNRFDPDSDEFFEDAEYEAFMDQGPLDVPLPLPLPPTDSSSSSSSEDSDSASGRDSPPVRMTAIWDRLLDEEAAAAYQPVPEEQLLLDIPGYALVDDLVTIHAADGPPRAVTVTVHPPSALRNSTTATDLARARGSTGSAPITIPRAPSTPEPDSPASSFPYSASPSTPPAVYAHLQLTTPSPPPTVTPRIYMWGARPHPYAPASPASPTSARHTHPAGPLTNPSARQSRTRITPARRVNESLA